MYIMMSSANRDSFTSSFQFVCLLFLFLVWSLWLQLPILCWLEVVKMDTLVLFLIFVGKFLAFAHWVWCWLYVFIMLRNAPSVPTLLSVFIISGCCTLSNAFSASIDMVMWFLSFILFIWYVTFIDFCAVWKISRLSTMSSFHSSSLFSNISLTN